VTTKNNPAKATDAHISVIAHVTNAELGISLSRINAANGFLNRFLTIAVRRSKYLPDGAAVPDALFTTLGYRLHEALDFGRRTARMNRDEAAAARWRQVYPRLTRGHLGLLGAALSRGEAQTMRLACLYALLDRSDVVRLDHLEAALALWDYVEASSRHVYGKRFGNPDLDKLNAAIQGAGEHGLTRTEIRNLFQKHKQEAEVVALLTSLADLDLIRPTTRETGGRTAEVWIAHTPTPQGATEATEATGEPNHQPSVASVAGIAAATDGSDPDPWEAVP